MIFIKAKDITDLKFQLRGIFHKSKILESFKEHPDGSKTLRFTKDWADYSITIEIPLEYIDMDVNIHYMNH